MEKQTNKQTNSPLKSNLPCRPIVKPGWACSQSAEWWRYVRQCPVMLVTLREGYLNKWSRITCCSRRKPLINTTHTANARPGVGQVRFFIYVHVLRNLSIRIYRANTCQWPYSSRVTRNPRLWLVSQKCESPFRWSPKEKYCEETRAWTDMDIVLLVCVFTILPGAFPAHLSRNVSD